MKPGEKRLDPNEFGSYCFRAYASMLGELTEAPETGSSARHLCDWKIFGISDLYSRVALAGKPKHGSFLSQVKVLAASLGLFC